MDKYLEQLAKYLEALKEKGDDLSKKDILKATKAFFKDTFLPSEELQQHIGLRIEKLKDKELTPAEFVKDLTDFKAVMDIAFKPKYTPMTRSEYNHLTDTTIGLEAETKGTPPERVQLLHYAVMLGRVTNKFTDEVAPHDNPDKNIISFDIANKLLSNHGNNTFKNNMGKNDELILNKTAIPTILPVTLLNDKERDTLYMDQFLEVLGATTEYNNKPQQMNKDECQQALNAFYKKHGDFVHPTLKNFLDDAQKYLDKGNVKAFQEKITDHFIFIRDVSLSEHYAFKNSPKSSDVEAAKKLEDYKATGKESDAQSLAMMAKMIRGYSVRIDSNLTDGVDKDVINGDEMAHIRKLGKELGYKVSYKDNDGLLDEITISKDGKSHTAPVTLNLNDKKINKKEL